MTRILNIHKPIRKKYYNIGEVATMLNVYTSKIRYWQKAYNMRDRRRRSGQRVFIEKDIDTLLKLKELTPYYTEKGIKKFNLLSERV